MVTESTLTYPQSNCFCRRSSPVYLRPFISAVYRLRNASKFHSRDPEIAIAPRKTIRLMRAGRLMLAVSRLPGGDRLCRIGRQGDRAHSKNYLKKKRVLGQSGTAKVQPSLSRASPARGPSMVLAGLFIIPALFARKRGSPKRGAFWKRRIGAICLISLCAELSGCGRDRFVLIGAPQTYQLVVQGSAVDSGLTKQTIATLVVTQ
jgi:hypothetical protein